jgi:hypothetical protein
MRHTGIIATLQGVYSDYRKIQDSFDTIWLDGVLDVSALRFTEKMNIMYSSERAESDLNVLNNLNHYIEYGVKYLVIDKLGSNRDVAALVLKNRILPILRPNNIQIVIKNSMYVSIADLVVYKRLIPDVMTMLDLYESSKNGVNCQERVQEKDFRLFINTFDFLYLCALSKGGARCVIGDIRNDVYKMRTYIDMVNKYDGSIIYYGDIDSVSDVNLNIITNAE